MKIRKIIASIVLILILILKMTVISNAANIAKFSVSSGSAKSGEEITIDINLDSESDFVSADLVLNYDTKKLQFVKYQEGQVLKEGAMNIVKDNPESGKIAIGFVANPTISNQIRSIGNMLSITFKIISTVDDVTELRLECTSLKNDNGNDIENTVNDGTISIKANTGLNNNSNVGDKKENISYNPNVEDSKVETDNNEKNYISEAPGTLPKAGNTVVLIHLIVIVISILSTIFYKKYNNLRGI